MIIKVDKKHSPDRDKIAPKKLISGSGETSLWNAFSDPSDQFHVGHWMSDPCEINVSYTENELCVIIERDAELTDEFYAAQKVGAEMEAEEIHCNEVYGVFWPMTPKEVKRVREQSMSRLINLKATVIAKHLNSAPRNGARSQRCWILQIYSSLSLF